MQEESLTEQFLRELDDFEEETSKPLKPNL